MTTTTMERRRQRIDQNNTPFSRYIFMIYVLFLSLTSISQCVYFTQAFNLPEIPFFSTVTSNTNANRATPIQEIPIVICPGFGNDSIDYLYPLKQPRSKSLIESLEKRGFNPSRIYTIPIKRTDWIRVALGLLDVPRFYTGDALPTGLGYGWYIQRLKDTVNKAYSESIGNDGGNLDGTKVILIAHSAGGWLARAAMGDGKWSQRNDSNNSFNADNDTDNEINSKPIRTADRVRCLVTLGAIHKAPEDPTTCVTRGALLNTNKLYPGDFLRKEGIGYVSIGGGAVVGKETVTRQLDDANGTNLNSSTQDADDLYSVRGEGSAASVAYTSYKAVSGEGSMIGDGVVPLEWTQLEGAKQIKLDGVVHSINEAGTTIPSDRWYGSDDVIDRWLPAVLKEAMVS